MKEIAVYGKGGIGKSTISANLSAALAVSGRRVLQIGCDPKHDSTRLLTHGAKQTTALDYMRATNPSEYRLEKILLTGFGGIGCVEAGGPEPGVGCAGRGIISAFELLDQFKLKEGYDHIVYDVLGDVVCGGFAVPIRQEYADMIFIVTSGEFMSLYAANNILRGVKNYDHGQHRIAGIIFNKRGLENEEERVRSFARAVGLPVCAEIPRSESFAQAEQLRMTVIEQNADAGLVQLFLNLAKQIVGKCALYAANPLEDEALESLVLGGGVAASFVSASAESSAFVPSACVLDPDEQPSLAPVAEIQRADNPRYISKNVKRGEPLHGCAFNGAMTVCVQISGAVILAHAPKSCAYITLQTISSTGRRSLFERGALLPVSIAPNLECTEMGETEMVFGGMEKLTEKVKEIKTRDPRAIIVVSACPAGIIGDDIDRVRSFSDERTPVVTIRTDGNMTGDFLQGMLTSCVSVARQVIRRNVPVSQDTVNIIAEKIILTNTEENFKTIEGFLSRMGVRVNCRFVYDTSVDAIENLCAARLNLLAFKDYGGQMFESFLKAEYGCKFFDQAFPVGFAETETWLRGIAGFFGCPQTAESIIRENKEQYDRGIEELRPALKGKKLMIITYNHELDWILSTALDIGIEIVKIGILNFSQDEGFRTKLSVPLPVEDKYDRENRAHDVDYYRPDILLTNYQSSLSDGVLLADTIPMCPDVGFFSGLDLARRWAGLLKLDQKGAWRQDESLLDKYYA